ncbi:carbonic anhydrase 7-like [Anopheles cruzii]|uniref:carbonic anhydrase 7-like n=1 Tax=Anopheles cruzii TaxID=68878 RepID=UPI0022EC1EF3|nr:carbonic anhydrase 7-like [Anopheles cruzii]
MSALCLSLLFACQPVVFSRGLQDERSDFWWSKGYPGHPNDIDYGQHPAASGARQSSSASASWSYSIKDAVGPPNWSIVAPACAGLYQSPINIVTKETLFIRKKVPLELEGLRNLPSAMTVENEGTSVKFEPHWSGRTRPTLRGGPLRNKYIFEQLHFHWGPENTLGSEHSLDGQKFPLEVHLVFYNGLYGSFDEAKREMHGLAVVAFFYEVVPNSEDYSLNRWTNFLPPVRKSGSALELSFSKSFSLNSVIGAMGWPYYSYEGSLTTPPCLETVTWIVASKRLAITEREMNLLRALDGATGGPLLQNYRPTQPVNNRRVFRY